VETKDLPNGCHSIVTVLCDYCKKERKILIKIILKITMTI
jgi:hypothetical protein